jgi:hypothetical protein
LQPDDCTPFVWSLGRQAKTACGYLSKAYRRRFSAINGVEAMKAVAAGRDPVDEWMMWLPCRRSRMRRRMVELAVWC